MSLIYSCGFDGSNGISDLLAGDMTGVIEGSRLGISPSTRFNIGNCVSFAPAGVFLITANQAIYRTLELPITSGFVGVAMQYISGIDGWASPYITFDDVGIGSLTQQCSLLIDPVNARLVLQRGNLFSSPTTLATSPPNSISANVWFYVEVAMTIGSSVNVQVNLNGANIINVSGVNTQSTGNSTFQAIEFGAYGNGIANMDDIYVCDTTGSPPFNTFLGPIQIYSLFPNGPGNSTDFIPLSGANWQEVNSVFNNGATYNYSSTVSAADQFTIQPLPSNLRPLATCTKLFCKQGNGGTHTMETLLQSEPTLVDGVVLPAFQGGFHMQADIWELDPNGSIPWTNASVSAAQIGYEIVS